VSCSPLTVNAAARFVSPARGATQSQGAEGGDLAGAAASALHCLPPLDPTGCAAAPVLSAARPSNSPQSGSASVLITGLAFANADPTASIELALASCSTASWSSVTSALCISTASGTSGLAQGLSIAIAGVSGTGASIFFDATFPGQWTTARSMPAYQTAFAWAYESSRLVLIGGQNPTAPAPSEVLNAVYVLNPATDAWTSKKSMPSTRYGRAAHALACVV